VFTVEWLDLMESIHRRNIKEASLGTSLDSYEVSSTVLLSNFFAHQYTSRCTYYERLVARKYGFRPLFTPRSGIISTLGLYRDSWANFLKDTSTTIYYLLRSVTFASLHGIMGSPLHYCPSANPR
jgi:hypothetical protein